MVAIANNFDVDEILASNVGGLVLCAPKGTTAPADATADWAAGWKSVGIISDDGVTIGIDTNVEDKKAWNVRGVVKRIPQDAGLAFQFTAMQTNELTHELFFGEAPTAVGSAGHSKTDILAVSAVNDYAFAVEFKYTDGSQERYIMPIGNITDRGDIQQTETDLKQFQMTVSALVVPGTTTIGYILSDSASIDVA